MKTVFTEREVAHVWASRSQYEGRNRGKTLFFEGNVIYSYGGHFPIARFVEAPNGQTFVLYNDSRYSSTTAKHQSRVRMAINQYTIVPTKDIQGNKADIIADGLVNKIEDFVASAGRRQLASTRVNDIIAARELSYVLEQWCEAYSIRRTVTIPDLPTEEELAQERDRKESKTKATYEEQLAKWRKGGSLPSVRHGQRSAALRLRNGMVQTSQGVNIKSDDPSLRQLFRLATQAKEADKSMVFDGGGPSVGMFTLRLIHHDGSVQVGCHQIQYDEMAKLAKELWHE